MFIHESSFLKLSKLGFLIWVRAGFLISKYQVAGLNIAQYHSDHYPCYVFNDLIEVRSSSYSYREYIKREQVVVQFHISLDRIPYLNIMRATLS